MSSGGYLAAPDSPDASPEQIKLWDATWKRLDRFLPGLCEEIFPDEAAKQKGGRGPPVPSPTKKSSEAPRTTEKAAQKSQDAGREKRDDEPGTEKKSVEVKGDDDVD